VQYKKEIIQSSPAVDAFSQQALHSFQYANINHKRRFSASARVPSSTICSFQYGLSSTLVQSLSVKVLVSSTKKVSRHAFGFASLAFEPITSTNSSAKAATGVQASAVKNKTNDFRQGATSHFYDDHLRRLIVEYQTKISLHLSEDFEIFCEGEWEQSQQLTRIFDNNSNAAISQRLVGLGQTGLVGLVGHIGSVNCNGSVDCNGLVG